MSTLIEALSEAVRLHQAGQFDMAAAIYRDILKVDAHQPDALHLLGMVVRRSGDAHSAADLIVRAIRANPKVATYHNNLGTILQELGKPGAAESCFRTALDLKPGFAEALANLGNVLRSQGNAQDAISAYRGALRLNPRLAEVHNNLGNALRDIGKLDQAAASYSVALELHPDYAEAMNNLGTAFKEGDDLDRAIDCYRRSLELKPGNPDTLTNLASAFKERGEMEEALACYRDAIERRPDDASARWAMAMTHLPLVCRDEAEAQSCRAAFSEALAELDAWFTPDRLGLGVQAVGSEQPYYLAYQEEENTALLSRYGRLCSRLMAHWQDARGYVAAPLPSGDRIRVGIISSHIQDHSVWHALIKGWLRHLDRNRFELHVFSLGSIRDAETELARARADVFITGPGSFERWVEAILASKAQVLIYPEIGMDPMTIKLASLRLAPVQVAAWGHPETTGLPTIDGYLSAKLFEAHSSQHHYTERLVELPGLGCCYLPLDIQPEATDMASPGLDDARLLLCPGTPYKYAPRDDWVWPEISRGLDNCKLVFFQHRRKDLSHRLRQRLETAFSHAGLRFDDHAAFLPWQSRRGFYGLMQRATAYLDSIGFSGFNTAMQAVECGLPVVTLDGAFMRGRLASGILKRIGLTGSVAQSTEEYVALARKMVLDPDYRDQLSHAMRAARGILFDDLEPVRALEDFLLTASTGAWPVTDSRAMDNTASNTAP